jgi:hypothetical protein
MPFKEIYVQPELVLEHGPFKVYRAYKDHQADEPLEHWFQIFPRNDPETHTDLESYEFDPRDQQSLDWKDPSNQTSDDYHDAIRTLIDRKVVPSEEWLTQHSWDPFWEMTDGP